MELQSGAKIVAHLGFLDTIYSYTSSKCVKNWWEQLEESSRKSTRHLSKEVLISSWLLLRTLHEDLRLFPHKIQILQMQAFDNKAELVFCHDMSQRTETTLAWFPLATILTYLNWPVYFHWGHLKERIYNNNPLTLADLKDNIKQEIKRHTWQHDWTSHWQFQYLCCSSYSPERCLDRTYY